MTTETITTETTTPEIASERGLLIAVLLMVSFGTAAMFLIG
ncbi:hypothetical protein [Catenuloplanes japonicus]|nr:hypothetical protein [Catenuloplanes japonicus]